MLIFLFLFLFFCKRNLFYKLFKKIISVVRSLMYFHYFLSHFVCFVMVFSVLDTIN